MTYWKTAAILLGMGAAAIAQAQPRLVPFATADGCRMLVAAKSIDRLNEIAAQGSVRWQGSCKNGLIDGHGVLREEGRVEIGAKTKQYAYFLTGNARNGIRSGTWRRETFDRFADSPRFYTSAATLAFVDGATRGEAKLIAITSIDQLTAEFRKFVIEARREATPANTALLAADPTPVAAAPAPAPTPTPAVAAAAAPASDPPAGKSAPAINSVPADAPPAPKATPARGAKPAPAAAAQSLPRFSASSKLQQLGPEGLATAAQPGWHSASPPDFPEWVIADFQAPRRISAMGMRPQDGHLERSPKVIRLEASMDGQTWGFVAVAENPCDPASADSWTTLKFPEPASARYIRISILSNCGDPTLVTIRGLRFE